jgi:hypothetical protein
VKTRTRSQLQRECHKRIQRNLSFDLDESTRFPARTNGGSTRPAAQTRYNCTMRVQVVALAFPLLAMPVGCAKRSPPSERAGPRFVAAFEQESRLAYFQCKDEGCLTTHEADCQPAHLHRAIVTIEGSRAFLDTYVRPTGGGCEAVQFGDYSVDYWGGCRVRRSVCPSTANFKDQAWDRERCTQTVLYTAPLCEYPYK